MRIPFFTIYILLFVVGFFGLIYMHEQAHVEIFRSYGINSHVEYFSHLPDAVTIPDGNYSKCDSYCNLAHNIDDIVGYHLEIIYAVFGLGIFVILIMLELIWEVQWMR